MRDHSTGYTGPGGDLVIPARIGRETIKAISTRAFSQKGLNSVPIPNGLSIGGTAFPVIPLPTGLPNKSNKLENGGFNATGKFRQEA